MKIYVAVFVLNDPMTFDNRSRADPCLCVGMQLLGRTKHVIHSLQENVCVRHASTIRNNVYKTRKAILRYKYVVVSLTPLRSQKCRV